MKQPIRLQAVLAEPGLTPEQRMALFGLLNLGLIESLAGGSLTTSEAVRLFFHAENCLLVRQHMHNRAADEVMSRGVQLSDLFETLPAQEAHLELQRELASMRALCLTLLAEERLAA